MHKELNIVLLSPLNYIQILIYMYMSWIENILLDQNRDHAPISNEFNVNSSEWKYIYTNVNFLMHVCLINILQNTTKSFLSEKNLMDDLGVLQF